MVRQFLHIILGISIFFSTTGLVVVQHFCEQELKSTGFFVEAGCCSSEIDQEENCCKILLKDQCCKLPKEQGGKGCCDSKSQYILSELPFFAPTIEEHVEKEAVKSLKNHTVSFIYQASSSFENHNNFPTYKAPTIVPNLRVLFQSFLC